MCWFASFILTKDREYWASGSDSHESIIKEYNLQDDLNRVQIVRVELTPPVNDPRCADLALWQFRVDQDMFPEWTYSGDPALETRTRLAAARRAEEERWWVVLEGLSAVGGYASQITGGDDATVTGGNYATVTGGNYAKVTGGDYAKVTGGDCAKVTGGDCAKVTGGDGAQVTGGNCAQVTGGNCAQVTGGNYAKVAGGDGAVLSVYNWDQKANRWRLVVGYVGEDGIEAGIPYCVKDGCLVDSELCHGQS
jgi:hypothetical protein